MNIRANNISSRFSSKVMIGGIVFALGAGLTANTFAQESTMQESIIIVLDGSGSMWGQIEGVPKLTIARQTLREVLQSVPSNIELGLVAYGHRVKGDCGDIELVVPAASGTADEIIDEVDNMSFLGKTPLGDSVLFAAEELKYTEDKATIVLITDGIETCGANICELANSLENLGLDFKAHVVGFGLSEEEGSQISCLANNTGGEFFLANDAPSLVAALNQIVVAIVPRTMFVARDQEGVIVDDVSLVWEIRNSVGDVVAEAEAAGSIKEELEPGNYSVLVSAEGISGGIEFVIEPDAGEQNIDVPVERIILSAELSGPEQVAAGSEFEVIWDGPDDERDYVTIVAVDAREGAFLGYGYTQNGSPALVRAPDEFGTYELRYVHGPSDKTLATAQIEVVEVFGTVEAPAEVAAGAEFEVIWTGPSNQGDYITIVAAGAEESEFEDYAYTQNGSPAKITAPDGIGDFEVRYVFGQSRTVLASTPIVLTEVAAKLQAPDQVGSGSEIEVIWSGPSNQGDYITIVAAGAEDSAYEDYAYTQNGSPAKISVPEAVGSYEVRYVLGQGRRVLAFVPITLTEVSAQLELQNTAFPGGKIVVNWKGPNNSGDYITIVEAGAPEGEFNDYAYTRNGTSLEIDVPRALGNFEVRYVMGQSERTLASVVVTLAPASATLSAPERIGAGAVVEITWTGPDGANDSIEIVEAGADAGAKPQSQARTSQGSPLSLFAPDNAGNYEVRYKMGDSGEVLASSPLIVE